MEPLRAFFSQISPLSNETWKEIGPLFRYKKLKSGEFFATEGTHAKHLGFLASGCVRAFFTSKEGKEYNKQFFVGPSLIGAYTSLLTGNLNLIPQQALTDCDIWEAPFHEISNRYSEFHDLESLSRRIAEFYFLEKERKELEMALQDARQRYLTFNSRFPGLDQQIPQYHIASYLGVTATQLSRIRRDLAEEDASLHM